MKPRNQLIREVCWTLLRSRVSIWNDKRKNDRRLSIALEGNLGGLTPDLKKEMRRGVMFAFKRHKIPYNRIYWHVAMGYHGGWGYYPYDKLVVELPL